MTPLVCTLPEGPARHLDVSRQKLSPHCLGPEIRAFGFWGEISSTVSKVLSGRKILFKVPEGHHPRGTTLREALRGNSPLRGLCGGLSEGSAGSLRGCGVSAGFCGGPRDFPRVPGVVTLCL